MDQHSLISLPAEPTEDKYLPFRFKHSQLLLIRIMGGKPARVEYARPHGIVVLAADLPGLQVAS